MVKGALSRRERAWIKSSRFFVHGTLAVKAKTLSRELHELDNPGIPCCGLDKSKCSWMPSMPRPATCDKELLLPHDKRCSVVRGISGSDRKSMSNDDGSPVLPAEMWTSGLRRVILWNLHLSFNMVFSQTMSRSGALVVSLFSRNPQNCYLTKPL